jgi:ribonuclease J
VYRAKVRTSDSLMLEIVALGGLGEFGMNMLALTWGDTTIVVDAGVMFPDPELLGVDLIIPDLTYLQQKGRVAALVLTHGHEDHIGAVPYVLPLIDGPVYGTPLTLAFVEPKLLMTEREFLDWERSHDRWEAAF